MLRLTEIKLSLEHDAAALRAKVLEVLAIPDQDLLAIHIRRRGNDARKRGVISFVYTLTLKHDMNPTF